MRAPCVTRVDNNPSLGSDGSVQNVATMICVLSVTTATSTIHVTGFIALLLLAVKGISVFCFVFQTPFLLQ